MPNRYKDFQKEEHPEMYSDSTSVTRAKLNREDLGFILSTITAKNKEHEFEEYCREMVRLTVTPNLIPQTGPTGGGDSKVDSETYPVDETLAERLPFSVAVTASGERWAFAISAKQDWRSKVASDIHKVAEVERDSHRGFKRAFFLSSQLISDKKRAEVEDRLRSETGLDVRIYDQNWLINASFSSERAKLETIRTLAISDGFLECEKRGPLDTSRRARLEEIEGEIVSYDNTGSKRSLVELADEAAEITCQLEESDIQVMNMLDRHYRLAMRYGDQVQVGEAIYRYAYRLVGWCEDPDYDVFYERYLELEKLTLGNRSLANIANLITLWTVMRSSCPESGLAIDYDKHTQTLFDIERELAEDGDRLSSSIEVSMRMLPVRLIQGESADDVLDRAASLMERSRELRGIDYRIVVQLLRIPGTFEACDRFDEVMDLVYSRVRDDEGAESIAPLLYERANSLQDSGRHYEAVRKYTHALTCIRSDDDGDNYLKVCLRMSQSCERVGLFMLARSLRSLVLNLGLDAYYGRARLTPLILVACGELKYDELRTGNLQSSIKLACLEAHLRELFPDTEYGDRDPLAYDQLLGLSMLSLRAEELGAVPRLVEQLDDRGLPLATCMAKYALGYFDEETLRQLECDEAGFDELVGRLHGEAEEMSLIARAPTLVDTLTIEVSTKLLGCTVVVRTETTWQCYELSCTLLAAFEAFLGTGLLHDLFACEERFLIRVKHCDDAEEPLEVHEAENGFDVSVGPLGQLPRTTLVHKLRDFLTESLATFVSRTIPLSYEFESLRRMVEEDYSLDRMFSCADTVSIGGGFVESLPFGLKRDDSLGHTYPLRREQWPIVAKDSVQGDSGNVDAAQVVFAEAPSWAEAADTSQRDITFRSVIHVSDWDRAGWKGFAYLLYPDGEVVLGLVFANDAGRRIFERWLREGDEIISRIRVAIIKGIDARHPLNYRVAVGSDPWDPQPKGDGTRILASTVRLHTLEPNTHQHLNMFESALRNVEHVWIMPCLTGAEGPVPQSDLKIRLKATSVSVLEAFEVTRTDYLPCSALMPFDDPVIPEDAAGSEIEEIMSEIRNRRGSPRGIGR